jgi:hypothetical protein
MKTKTLPTAPEFGKNYKLIYFLQLCLFVFLDEYLPKPDMPKKELKWEDDLELRSKFIDRRVSKTTTM